MITRVQNALNSVLGSFSLLNYAAGAGRIFELFVMTGIAAEMQNRNFEVWLQRSDGTRIQPTDPDRTFFQRGGAPAGIPPSSAGATNASVIGLRRLPNGDLWEIWNGIQFRGRSGALHEFDIALVPGTVGDTLRISGGTPLGRPRVAIECKDVKQAGSVDEMRAFVARLYDVTLLQAHQSYVQYPGPAMGIYPGSPTSDQFYTARVRYWDENRHTFNAVARRSGFTAGAAALTAYYAIEGHPSITAGSNQANALIDAICKWIEDECP
jgi:hypothetical protein